MKKIILLLAFLTATCIKAQNFGKITVYSKTNQAFMMSFNGVRCSNDFSTKITLDYADETDYRVKLWLPSLSYAINFNITGTPGYETVYLLEKDQYGAYALTMESKIKFSALPTTTVISSPTVVATTTVPVIKEMTDSDFKSKLASVKAESFDDKRFSKIKFLFTDEYLSSVQSAELVKLFSFDSKKVDAGKFLYKRTLDKKNYYKVVDVITFDSYKKDLQDWIIKNPNG